MKLFFNIFSFKIYLYKLTHGKRGIEFTFFKKKLLGKIWEKKDLKIEPKFRPRIPLKKGGKKTIQYMVYFSSNSSIKEVLKLNETSQS